MVNLYKKTAGIDVHKKLIVASICTVDEAERSKMRVETREFKGFTEDLDAMARWLKAEGVELATMESTSIYWMQPYEALERQGVKAIIANAQHVKNVPGRKTDVNDSVWLAHLTMNGLVNASLVPTKDIRALRTVARRRSKVIRMAAAEKTRLGKFLDSIGIRLGSILSSLDGVAARAIVDALLADTLDFNNIRKVIPSKCKIKATDEDLRLALPNKLAEIHKVVVRSIVRTMDQLNSEIAELGDVLLTGMNSYSEVFQRLQTMPGVDKFTAALIIVETGGDMSQFKGPKSFAGWTGLVPGNNESAGKKKFQDSQS